MEDAHRDLNGRSYRLADTLTRPETFLRKNLTARQMIGCRAPEIVQ
jgi:hypothetical protein